MAVPTKKKATKKTATQKKIETSDPQLARLVKLTTKEPVNFSELCNKLDVSPKALDSLIKKGRTRGLQILVEHDHVGTTLRHPTQITDVGIQPVVGKKQKIGVISDLHYGSKYCLREQIKDCVNHFYDVEGVREILVPGDVTEGMYRHAKFERSAEGLHDQVAEMYEHLPQRKGLTYHCITGNHDVTHISNSGVDFGMYVEDFFRRRGRNDINFYGDRGAYLQIRGAKIHMWHPGGGGSYALSYKLQNKVAGYLPGQKPQILLTGHWHKYCHVYVRGVHAFLCGTFHGGGGQFGKSLGDRVPIMIGGMVLSWTVTETGAIRDFGHSLRVYQECEELYTLDESNSGEESFAPDGIVPVQPQRTNFIQRVKIQPPSIDGWM